MSKTNMTNHEDDFWDLSAYVREKATPSVRAKNTDATDVFAPSPSRSAHSDAKEQRITISKEDTLIQRRIAPESTRKDEQSFSSSTSYTLRESPIHRVTLKKWKCAYHFYDEFLSDALRYQAITGEDAPYVSFFSYVPQYNQLSREQLACYLSFREACRRGEFPKTDYSYLLLYVFELINLGTHADVHTSQRMLVELWKHYHDAFPAIEGKLSRWICDFSLIHRLPPPLNATSEMVRNETVLKEFYITMPSDDMRACVRSLLRYCSSYDYRTSKFATEQNRELYDRHVLGALSSAFEEVQGDKGFLEGFCGEDCRMIRNAYEGALCCEKEKYRIEIEYCSFSRTNELRFLVGDMVKYAENKLRAYLGVKSKLSVYSVSREVQEAMDRYFAKSLPPHAPTARKKEQPQPYDALYELPKKEFSLSDAHKIERDSWETTNHLVSAFDENDETFEEQETVEEMLPASSELEEASSLADALGTLLPFVRAVEQENDLLAAAQAKKLGKMQEGIADEVNEIAVEIIGDVLLEHDGVRYVLIEDYKDML